MSELTKIAAILFKNLSDALLTTASELSKLETSQPLSQANELPKLESLNAKVFHKRIAYEPRDKVLVQYPDLAFPQKCRILKRLSESEYLVYPQGGLKANANKVEYDQILGIDPDG